MTQQHLKKALFSAFFVFFLTTKTLAATSPCLPHQPQSSGTVGYINDGDTLKLEDGRRIRLLGIDTPEIDHEGENSQPLAHQAKRRLTQLAPVGSRITLQPGKLQKDRFGRLLAYLRNADGFDPAEQLLREGLATLLIIPPNTAAADCYQRALNKARAHKLGLWSLPQFQPVRAATLPQRSRGFRVVYGKIMAIDRTRHFYLLNLDQRLQVRISKGDWLAYFSTAYPSRGKTAEPTFLTASNIQVMGRIYPSRGNAPGALRMRLFHPSGLEWPP